MATRRLGGCRHWLVLVLLALLALHQEANVKAQRGEPTNELPEDCGQDQFYNQLEMRCQNCSDVMQLFEAYQPQETPTNNRAPTTTGNQNNDATTILIGGADQSKQSDHKAQQFMRLVQRLPQLNGNKSRSAASTSGAGGRARARPAAAASDAVLSRFVAKSATRESSTIVAGNSGEAADSLADEAGAEPLELLAPSNNELDETARGGAVRSARAWQKLLTRFVQSNEFGSLNLPESIQQCKQMQNLTACQMWSNLCVLSMYAHTADSSASGRRSGLVSGAGQPRASPTLRHLQELAGVRMSWQKCPKFGLASTCNSLREWHQSERLQQAQLELNDIFADEQETATLAGEAAIKTPPLSLVLQLDKPVQLLAYKYALSGQLIEVNQFNLNDLRRSFCVRANNKLSLDDKLKFTDNLNLFLDTNYVSLDEHQDQDELLGQLRVGQNVELACDFSPLEANLFAPSHLNETHFVDLFIAQPASNGAMSLRQVPILIENLLSNQQLNNVRFAQDPSRWRLVHRFFGQATLKVETRDSLGLEEEVFIYARGLKLELTFKRQQDKGLILSSILLRLDYDYLPLVRSALRRQLQQQTLAANEAGNVSAMKLNLDEMNLRKQSHGCLIQVSQSLLDMLTYKKDFDLFLTILCLISCIWSLIRTYNVQTFQGFIKLDIYSLFLFLLISCDMVANLMLALTLLFGLHLFAGLKLHPLVMSVSQLTVFAPHGELESTLLSNLQLALVFKILALAYKLFIRLKADTFFIDWERPKMLTSTQLINHQAASRAGKAAANQTARGQQQNQVSFWRQYSIVNRWLQMQTMRRIDFTTQLLLFLLAFHCLRLDQLATADARLRPAGAGLSQQNVTFRAVLMALVYLSLALLQVAYKRLLHEPMIRSQMREFTDLCSVSNVSLISMLYPRFGYYIHGRNANGSSECGIAEMNALLELEERDLCSKRGLLPNSDHQTFVLLLPKIINDHYRKLLFRSSGAPLLANAPSALDGFQLKSALNLSGLGGGGVAAPSSLSASSAPLGLTTINQRRSLIESAVARNKAVNVFLINYLEHVYKDIDYSIRERKRFRGGCLFEAELNDANYDEEAPTGLGNKLIASRAPLATIDRTRAGAAGSLMANQQGEGGANGAHRARGLFLLDHDDSFANLLWLGLEWDLVVLELLMLLNLDLWLGRANLLLTLGSLWIINRLFKSIYVACARNNLIVKSMLDDKFVIR